MHIMKRLFIAIAAGLCLGFASWLTESTMGAALAWICVIILVYRSNDQRKIVLDFFIFGLVFHLAAFYWLPYTIEYFGGFSPVIAYPLFAFFCVVSSLQFVLCAWLRKSLPLSFAWLIAEFFIPRLFPWVLAHTQITWGSFANLASYFGVFPLSFLMILWVEICFKIAEKRKLSFYQGAVVVVSILALVFSWQTKTVDESAKIKVALIQGNLEAKQKRDIKQLSVNLERYLELSKKAISEGAEVVLWPESVITSWIPEEAEQINNELNVPLLFGGLSFRRDSEVEKFNTAFGIDEKGAVQGVYHKRILMPFGEYLPFAETFPSIKKLSPYTGDFTKGDILEPIKLKSASFAALICYEDLVPSLSRELVKEGAQILVNLTNDAWYGDTHAPYQHNLLAAWRAIETKRYLLRVTNTGYTTVINPLGETVQSLGLFTEGYLLADVAILDEQSFYVRYGNVLVWVLLGFGILSLRQMRPT